MKDRIIKLKELPDDWNGYGASSAKPEAINNAILVVELLQKQPDAIYLDDGDVVMVWEPSRDNSLLVCAGDEGLLCYYDRQPNKPDNTKSNLTEESISKILELISRFGQQPSIYSKIEGIIQDLTICNRNPESAIKSAIDNLEEILKQLASGR